MKLLLAALLFFINALDCSSLQQTSSSTVSTANSGAPEAYPPAEWTNVARVSSAGHLPGQVVHFTPVKKTVSYQSSSKNSVVVAASSHDLEQVIRKKPLSVFKQMLSPQHKETLRHHRTSTGLTLLHVAAVAGKSDYCDYLVSLGISLDSRDGKKNTPLHLVLRDPKMTAHLIKAGASVRARNEKGLEPLHVAASRNYTQALSILLSNGADMNARVATSLTSPLLCAVTSESEEFAVQLINMKANPDIPNDRGETPLSWSVTKNNGNLIRRLLAAGASVHVRDKQRRTPLHWGVYCLDTARQLVEAGADVNARDSEGKSPLSWAAYDGLCEVVEYLLQKGARVRQADRKGRTPLEWAATQGRENVVALLLMHGAFSQAALENGGSEYFEPLTWAASYGHLPIVKMLVDQGMDVNGVDTAGKTPLIWAAIKGHADVVRFLLSKKAKVNKKDQQGQNALGWASFGGFEEVVDLLLEYNANPEISDAQGKTPLHWAVAHPTIVKKLLSAGAHPNSKDLSGSTPLSWAAFNGHLASVQELVTRGADINDCNTAKPSVLFWAVAHRDVMAYLLSCEGIALHGVSDVGETPLMSAAVIGNPETVGLLLAAGVEVDIVDSRGRTAFNRAMDKGDIQVCEKLMRAKADIKKADQEKQAPLAWAAHFGHDPIVRLLLNAQVDANAEDCKGATALSRSVCEGHASTAQLLLDGGADLNGFNQEEMTILHNAVIGGSYRIVAMILRRTYKLLNHQDTVKRRTALHWALRFSAGACKKHNKQNPEGVTLKILLELVKAGAQVDLVDKKGRTPKYYLDEMIVPLHILNLFKQVLTYESLSSRERELLELRINEVVQDNLVRARVEKNSRAIHLIELAQLAAIPS